MASKSQREIADMTPDELEQRLRDTREQLFNLRFKNSMRQLDNPLRIRHARRDVARILSQLARAAKGGTA